MKLSRILSLAALTAAFALSAQAADKKFELKTKPYPMDTCVVSGEKLGSMGDAFVFTEGNQEVQLCCKSCQKDFTKDKKASLAKITAAAKKVKPYPLTTCLVSGESLDPAKAVGIVREGKEVIFCCESCVKDFKKDQAKFLGKLESASAAAKP